MPSRGFQILVLLTLLTLLGCWFMINETGQDSGQTGDSNDYVFPDLRGMAEKISRIEIVRKSTQFELVRVADDWQNSGLEGFPAKQELVEGILASIAEIKYLEPKTKLEKHYPELGVENPGPDSEATRLVLKKGEEIVADLIVGQTKKGSGENSNAFYIRLANDERAWCVQGNLDVRRDMADWSDRFIADIKPGLIDSMSISQDDGEKIELLRKQPDDSRLTLMNVPGNAKVDRQYQIDYMAELFNNLSFDDVKKTVPKEFASARSVELLVHTRDQLMIMMEVQLSDIHNYAWASITAGWTDSSTAADKAIQTTLTINSKFSGFFLKLNRRFADRLRLRLHDIVKYDSTN